MATGTWALGWATGDIVTAAEFTKGAGSIFDSTLGVDAASISVTSIVATYAHLIVRVYARSDTAAASANAFVRFNNDSAANYDHQQLVGSAAAAAAAETFAASGATFGFIPANTAGANLFGEATIHIANYANASNNKTLTSTYGLKTGTSSGNLGSGSFAGFWRSSAAINRIDLVTTGNFRAGTRVTVYAYGA